MTQNAERKADRIRERRDREHRNIFSRLPATYAASRAQAQRMLAHAGDLSIVEWRTLWDLHEAGPATIRELAQIQRTDHSLISRALPQMMRKGFVTTRRDSEDGRRIIVELAEAGRAAFAQAAPTMKQRRDALRAEFTPDELATFVALLDRYEAFVRRPIDDILAKEPL